MNRRVGITAALLLASALALANTVALNPNRPETYTVVHGDTLWDISGKFLRDPWQWPEIWHINEAITNPHLIYPGDVLSLVYRDGKPMLEMSRGRGEAVQTVKLSPHARPVNLSEAIPTVPLEAIRPFLQNTRVVSERELALAPYILATRDGRLISGSSEQVYARGVKGTGKLFGIFRKGQAYRDPRSHNILGYEATYVGDAEVVRDGDPVTVRLSNTTREVMAGDRLLPHADDEDSFLHFTPHAPQTELNGKIIAVLDGVSMIGQYQVVVVNLGAGQLERGHVLSIHQSGRTVRDGFGKKRGEVTLPDEKAGVLMVFRSFEQVSYALVMNALNDIKVLDKVRNPD